MSFERVIHANQNGAIIFFSGLVGRWFEVFDSENNQIATTATEAEALAILSPPGEPGPGQTVRPFTFTDPQRGQVSVLALDYAEAAAKALTFYPEAHIPSSYSE